MTRKLFCAVLAFGLVVACGPFYKDDDRGRGGIPFLAKIAASSTGISVEVPLWVEAASVSQCLMGNGEADVRLARNKEGGFVPSEMRIACDSLKPIRLAELAELFPAGMPRPRESPLEAPKKPLVYRSEDFIVLLVDSSFGFFLIFNDDEIQLIRGSYGNREGVETEHTYAVVEDEGKAAIRTVRFRSRVLALHRFADW
ncbi:MAG: hypothetical protein GY722_20895 [bacterium]|nr:hypothetical protein [bacterium]